MEIGFHFFILLIISCIIYWLIPKQMIRNYFLSMVSILFIFYFDKYASAVVIFLVMYSFMFASLIEKKKNKKLFHKLGIVGLVLVLIVFKYLGFLSGVFENLSMFVSSLPKFKIELLVLPLGLSYIIFKHISYLTDIYWGVVCKGKFVDFFLYSSLFTIFVAGPIERFLRFKTQTERQNTFTPNYLEESFERIVYGLFKKFVVADWLGYLIAPVWINPEYYDFWIKSAALFGYSIQIYMDFSGYSDIAIGASRVYGIKIMENFNYPYFQSNISQFWRCWHISLSDWIRDYVFFPLNSIMNNKIWRIFFVPVIAMGICGLWHGAAFHFLLWGFCHGFAIFIFQIWIQIKRKNLKFAKLSNKKWFSFASTVFTFVYVSVCWLFFKDLL